MKTVEKQQTRKENSNLNYTPKKDELQIKSTKNYALFNYYRTNRRINEKHVDELTESIKQKNLLHDYPIKVNRQLWILDGQHRFEAAKKLGVAIYYKISERFDESDIARVNSSADDWKLNDYLDFYVTKNFQDYKIVKDFAEHNDISIYAAIGVLNGGSTQPSSKLIKQFEKGQFKVKSLSQAQEIISAINDYGQYFPYYKSKSFMNAISRLMKNEDYDHEKMLHKVSMQHGKLIKCTDVKQYLALFEEIFNYKSKADFVHFRHLN